MWGLNEPGGQFGLAAEPASDGGRDKGVGRARLDGDASPEQRIKRLPDEREPPAAREPQDAVATDRFGLLGRRIDASGRRLTEQQQQVERTGKQAVVRGRAGSRFGQRLHEAAEEVVDRGGAVDRIRRRSVGWPLAAVSVCSHGGCPGLHATRLVTAHFR